MTGTSNKYLRLPIGTSLTAKREAVYRQTQLSIVLFNEHDAESSDIPS